MGEFSIWHWLVVAIVAAVLFFGWKNLPDMSRSLGRSLRIFKTEIKGMSQDDKDRAEAQGDVPTQHEIEPGRPTAPATDNRVETQKILPQAELVKNSRPRPSPRPPADS